MLVCFLAFIVAVIGHLSSATNDYAQDTDKHLRESACRQSCESIKTTRKNTELNQVSFDECVQICVHKDVPESQFSTSKLGRSKKSLSRVQRSVKRATEDGSQENKNLCVASKDPNFDTKPIEVKGLKVDFTSKNPDVYVTWEPLELKRKDYNWTAYSVLHPAGTSSTTSLCTIVPENQTFFVVSREYWKYPEMFYIAVVAYPYHRLQTIELQAFDPQGKPSTFIPDFPTKDTPRVVGSVVGGLVAGILLLIIMFFGLVWRRRRLCPSRYPEMLQGALPEQNNSKDFYYSCYYPENDAFREKVASIVNYFRQNGYDVIMDVMVSREISSEGPTRWAERQIRKAKKVLIFLSPGLINLAFDEREGGYSQDINRVWVELEVLRDLYARNRSAAKMVCIVLPDSPLNTSDLPLWVKISYKWPEDAQKVLKRLNERPCILPV